jgi:DNA-binding MarR family transcriptional regulator
MNIDTKPEPQTSIPLQLYELFRMLRREFDTRARALGFTQGQWRVLSAVGRHEGISQAGLAEILEMQPIAIARVLGRMERNGLVERRPDPRDRRALKLFLTPAALPMLDQLRLAGDQLQAMAMADLTQADQNTLFVLLSRMRRSIEASNNQADQDSRQRGRAVVVGDGGVRLI